VNAMPFFHKAWSLSAFGAAMLAAPSAMAQDAIADFYKSRSKKLLSRMNRL